MTKSNEIEPRLSPSSVYERGVRDGLEMAARIADRHSALQQHYADVCEAAMPNSAHAFKLQKMVAQQMAEQIREAIGANDRSLSL